MQLVDPSLMLRRTPSAALAAVVVRAFHTLVVQAHIFQCPGYHTGGHICVAFLTGLGAYRIVCAFSAFCSHDDPPCFKYSRPHFSGAGGTGRTRTCLQPCFCGLHSMSLTAWAMLSCYTMSPELRFPCGFFLPAHRAYRVAACHVSEKGGVPFGTHALKWAISSSPPVLLFVQRPSCPASSALYGAGGGVLPG